MNSAPTLFVGLGGTGSRIIARVASKVTEKDREHIAFAIFDTDINDLRKIEKEYPFVHVVQTSQGRTVGEFLASDTHASETWFPNNVILNNKPLTEGAGQVRAISRLAFDMSVREGKLRPLQQAIESLYKLNKNHTDQALRVTVVSSLCGGTGSGLLLPVGLYIRNYLEKSFRAKDVIMRGFFLLPEVFYDVIREQREQNALRCNAYATLRELDAFMMKGEGFLPERYSKRGSVKLEIPREGADGYEEYNVLPYNFCFLYDGQNTSRLSLSNHNQYLDHAANCIYAQAVGATSSKSNSNEDNKVRPLIAGRGRNRYAGAGCSSLIYPYEDIRDYIAMRQALVCVSKQWLTFDEQFRMLQKKSADIRNRGGLVADDNRQKEYINSVENLANSGHPFAAEIVRQCYNHNEQGGQTTGRWEDFIEGLNQCVLSCSNDPGLNSLRDEAHHAIKKIQTSKDVYRDIENTYLKQMESYRNAVIQFCREKSRSTALTIFDTQSENVTRTKASQTLETYMRDNDGNFISPNAVRYFLYKLLETMKFDKDDVEKEYRDAENRLKELREGDGYIFDLDETERVETVHDLKERAKSQSLIDKVKFKLKGELSADQKDILDDFSTYMENVEIYRSKRILADVLEAGIEYVQSMIKGYEAFFDSFDIQLNSIKQKLADIVKRYDSSKGSTVHYVCASEKCLNKLAEMMPGNTSFIAVDSDLAENVYLKVRKYALTQANHPGNNEENVTNSDFDSIFYDGIIGHFQDELRDASWINMDIIEAIEREDELGASLGGMGDTPVQRAINTAKALAEPFIERVMGAEFKPIELCSCNPDIIPKDDSPHSQMIKTALLDAQPSEDMSVRRIDFYQAIYCMRANQLSKFAPGDSGLQGSGAYFRAYYETVNKITPRSMDSLIITPHIDRNWHIITNMPDLDEDYQNKQFNQIYRAFLFGFVYQWFNFVPTGRNKHVYTLDLPGKESAELVVSNGTPCDMYYEVLDALTANPVFVTDILAQVDIETRREINATSRLVFNRSYLYNRFNPQDPEASAIRITEFEKVDGREVAYFDIPNATIFDLSALIKLSTPSASFDENTGIEVLQALLDTVWEYITRMAPKEELADIFGDFVDSQFQRFAAHANIYQNCERYIEKLLAALFTMLDKESIEQGEIKGKIRNSAEELGWWAKG